jgi:hypothetical protein
MVRPKKTETVEPTPAQLALWTFRFAKMIQVGITLVRCMAVLEDDSTNGPLCDITRELHVAVEGGSTLSQAMRAFPAVFDEDYLGSVVTGEIGGILDQTMQRWAETLDRRLALAPATAATTRGQLGEWCWRFGHMWAAGVPVAPATETLARVCGGPLGPASAEIDAEVRAGGRPTDAMRRHPQVFPGMLVQMIAVAEETGEVADMLQEAAALCDREADYEAAGHLPRLWSSELPTKLPGPADAEHPVVRRANDILRAAFERGVQEVRILRGTAELMRDGQVVESMEIEHGERVGRRFKIMAAIDPFSRAEATGTIHVRWKDAAFTAHVASRPSAAGDQLFLRVTPTAEIEPPAG